MLDYIPTDTFILEIVYEHNSNVFLENKEQLVLHVLNVCLYTQLPRMQSTCTVLYCDLWPV
jgi:hypothetical protein